MSLKGISSMATRHLLIDLVGEYAREQSADVAIETVGGVEAARRVEAGETLDLVFLASDAIARLESAGHVLAGSRVDLVRSEIAVAVAAGAKRPDIASVESLKRTVLGARSVGYSTGPSGVHLARLFDEWGAAERVRLVQAPTGKPVGELVAQREVEIGFQQLSELIHLKGIDVLGTLPRELGGVTIFSGAVCATSTRAQEARAFLAFAAGPKAGPLARRHGLEPARRSPA
jgi:molybdate transport system substrate-binding protein